MLSIARAVRRIWKAQRAFVAAGGARAEGFARFEDLLARGAFDAASGLLSESGSRRYRVLQTVGAFPPGPSFWVMRSSGGDPELLRLCDAHGTDKGSRRFDAGAPSHNYAEVYSQLFHGRRQQVAAVLEVGIAKGASLRVWRDYFPNASIYGADIAAERLFDDERISCVQMDQTNPDEVRDGIRRIGSPRFDLIIDDGLHTFAANLALFRSASESLAEDGVYVVEDCTIATVEAFRRELDGSSFLVDAYVGFRPNGHKVVDNCLVVITSLSRATNATGASGTRLPGQAGTGDGLAQTG